MFLNDNNRVIKNDEELILYRKLAKQKLHKSILSEKIMSYFILELKHI